MIPQTILFVDDDEIFNYLNAKIVEAIGFKGNVLTSLNGKQALDVIERNNVEGKPKVDYIFLDLNMPVLDGFEFLEQFDNKVDTQVIVLSSSTDPNDVMKASELGAVKYLNKPLSMENLRKVLNMPVPL